MASRRCRIGFDIGGTFTDFVLVETDSRRIHIHKALTTAADPAAGSIAGLDELVRKAGVAFADVGTVVHGTTIVTNAVIERRGAPTALLTTRGFRDSLEMGTEQRYDIHDLFLKFPEPLVLRRLRFEVDERITRDGEVVRRATAEDIRAQLGAAVAGGAQAVAVSFLHAYRNDSHERMAARIAAEEFPGLYVSLSSEVCAEIREYERTTTTVANAYVLPLIDPYVRRLEEALQARCFRGQLLLMQSSGKIASTEMARRFPVRLLESGPAGGAIAAALLGRSAGHNDIIAFDMGGTTAKVCLIEDGKADVAPVMEAAREQRFKRGSGLPIRSPVIDMIEIGAGGGSIARVDELGLLTVGPRSAGSAPGPACYGAGGTAPTVTDANLLLGYLAPASFLGGRLALDSDAAERALQSVATPLGMGTIEVAWGVFSIVCENMAGAVRAHIVEKGRDPRNYAKVAFGGAGPAHAIRVAKSLGIGRVVIPPASGAASALGFLGGRIGHDVARSAPGRLAAADWPVVSAILAELEAEAREHVRRAGVTPNSIEIRREVDLRLSGQVHDLRVPVRAGPIDASAAAEIREAFTAEHRKLYARDPSHADVAIVSWRVTALGPAPAPTIGALARHAGATARKGERDVWFPETDGFTLTPVFDRYALQAGETLVGPAVIEEDESTTVVPPGDEVRVDEAGNLVIALKDASLPARSPTQALSLADAMARLESDPIGLEIMWSRLITISEECWLTVIRTAFSLIIGEMQDFACEILDADGQSLAHSPRAMPIFNITLMAAVNALLEAHPVDTLEPGDVLVTNDPWLCAGHLFDIAVVTPVFHRGKVVAFTGSIGHVSDIGGTKDRMRAREIYEEGFQIPPMKLYRAGVPNHDLFALLAKNVRSKAQVLGDIDALIAANAVGAQRLQAFLTEYDLDDLRALAAVIQRRAEMAMREAIVAVPDGVYSNEIHPLSCGERHMLPVRITVAGDSIKVDYDGCAAELPQGGLNCTMGFTKAQSLFALKCLLTPHVRGSAGCYRPMTVTAPEGSMLNCGPTASVGLRHLTGSYLVGNIFNAMSEALPRSVQGFSGLPAIIHFYGREGGRTHSDHLYLGGGQGGSDRADGKSGMLWPTSASNGSVEVLETRAPVLVIEKAFVVDGRGAGRFRGGLGQRMRVRRLRGDGGQTLVNSYPEGTGFEGEGLFGGKPASGSHLRKLDANFSLVKDYGEGSVETIRRPDEIIELRVGSGGGYGDPLTRPIKLVQSDLDDGYISAAHAADIYGCVIMIDGRIDAEATQAQRVLRLSTKGAQATGIQPVPYGVAS